MWTDNFYHMSDSVRSHARIFCNPHQLIRDDRIISLRREFFREYLSQCSLFMINTICPAKETGTHQADRQRKLNGRGESTVMLSGVTRQS